SATVETADAVGLTAIGPITQVGNGRIVASSLMTQSTGGLNLGGDNEISRLTATNNGGTVVVNNSRDLEIAGISQLDGGDVMVTSDGDVIISGAIVASGAVGSADAVELTATGSIVELGTGRIVASDLVTQSAGGLNLGGANEISRLTAINDGGAVVVHSGGDLEIVGISQLDGGDVEVTTEGALVLSGTIETADAVGLTANGSIEEEGAGRILA